MPNLLLIHKSLEIRLDMDEDELDDDELGEISEDVENELEMGLDAISRNIATKYGVTVEVTDA